MIDSDESWRWSHLMDAASSRLLMDLSALEMYLFWIKFRFSLIWLTMRLFLAHCGLYRDSSVNLVTNFRFIIFIRNCCCQNKSPNFEIIRTWHADPSIWAFMTHFLVHPLRLILITRLFFSLILMSTAFDASWCSLSPVLRMSIIENHSPVPFHFDSYTSSVIWVHLWSIICHTRNVFINISMLADFRKYSSGWIVKIRKHESTLMDLWCCQFDEPLLLLLFHNFLIVWWNRGELPKAMTVECNKRLMLTDIWLKSEADFDNKGTDFLWMEQRHLSCQLPVLITK